MMTLQQPSAFATTSQPQPSSIEALTPIFATSPQPHGNSFHVHAGAQQNLQHIGARLAGKKDCLLGLYVTESAEQNYNPDPAQYGRIVALFRVLPMPPGHSVNNYPSGCIEFIRGAFVDRWPIGWPAEPVFYSPHGGPVLRDAVRLALGISDYWSFASQFLQGPIDLRRLPALRTRLMIEIRHEIARNPQSQLQPF